MTAKIAETISFIGVTSYGESISLKRHKMSSRRSCTCL